MIIAFLKSGQQLVTLLLCYSVTLNDLKTKAATFKKYTTNNYFLQLQSLQITAVYTVTASLFSSGNQKCNFVPAKDISESTRTVTNQDDFYKKNICNPQTYDQFINIQQHLQASDV
jgi:hypothetical protein